MQRDQCEMTSERGGYQSVSYKNTKIPKLVSQNKVLKDGHPPEKQRSCESCECAVVARQAAKAEQPILPEILPRHRTHVYTAGVHTVRHSTTAVYLTDRKQEYT